MDRNLGAQQLVKWTLHQGPANRLGSPGEQLVEFLDVVAPGDAKELEHRLVVLESQYGLVAFG